MYLTDKQREFIRNANHRYNIKYGATRSGKTYLDISYVIPKRIRERVGKSGLTVILGVTKETIERNILRPMREIYSDVLVGDINNRNVARLFGEDVYCLGAEKVNQVSKIRGTSIKYLYCDELLEYNKEVFELLKSRLDTDVSLMDATFNPTYKNHWLKEFLDTDADIYQQRYQIDDNPTLPKEFVNNLKKEYRGTVWYNRYILGEWANAEGIIYSNFKRENVVIKNWYAKDSKGNYINALRNRVKFGIIGVDFGGHESATAFNFTVFTEGFKEVITVKEKYIKKMITPSELDEAFFNFYGECSSEFKVLTVFADSAETTLIKGLQAKMFGKVRIENARKGKVNDRIQFYIRLIGQHRYFIVEDCKETIEAFENALWQDKDKRLDNGTSNIDSLDAQEYSTEPYHTTIMAIGG